MIKANDRGGVGHHIQVVTSKSNFSIQVHQGNVGKPYVVFDSPRSMFYIGVSVTTGYYSLPMGNFINIDTRRTYSNGELGKYQYKAWNFKNFNKGR